MGIARLDHIDTWQVSLIEADVFVVFETIRQHAAVFDLREQRLEINALTGGPAWGKEVDSGGQQVAGAEDVPLFEMIARRRQFHQAMETFGSLPRFEGDQLLEVVMTLQKFAAVEELDPPL